MVKLFCGIAGQMTFCWYPQKAIRTEEFCLSQAVSRNDQWWQLWLRGSVGIILPATNMNEKWQKPTLNQFSGEKEKQGSKSPKVFFTQPKKIEYPSHPMCLLLWTTALTYLFPQHEITSFLFHHLSHLPYVILPSMPYLVGPNLTLPHELKPFFTLYSFVFTLPNLPILNYTTERTSPCLPLTFRHQQVKLFDEQCDCATTNLSRNLLCFPI